MGDDMFCGSRIWRQATLFLDAEISYDTIIFYLVTPDSDSEDSYTCYLILGQKTRK